MATLIEPDTGPPAGATALRRNWGWLLALGVLWIVLGTVAIFASVVFTLATVLLLGAVLLVGGVVHVVQAFAVRGWGGFFLHLLTGLLYVVAGFWMAVDPLGGAVALTLVLAAYFVVQGVFRIALAVQMRRFRNWGWALLSGVISLLLGVLIGAGWPASSLWVIGLFVGIEMLFGGWSLVALALAAHSLPAGTGG